METLNMAGGTAAIRPGPVLGERDGSTETAKVSAANSSTTSTSHTEHTTWPNKTKPQHVMDEHIPYWATEEARRVTTAIIENVLKKYPRARRIAVENFLASSKGLSYRNQLENLEYDAYLYKWKTDTKKAIRAGLFMLKNAGLMEP